MSFFKQPIKRGSPTFLWQRATPVIVGNLAGRTWKINKWFTWAPKLLCGCFCLRYIQFTYVVRGRKIQPGRPQVGDPCYRAFLGCSVHQIL